MSNNNNDEAKGINMDKFEEIEKNDQNNPSFIDISNPSNKATDKNNNSNNNNSNENNIIEKIKPPQKTSDNSIDSLNFLVHRFFLKNMFTECLEVLSKFSKNKNQYESTYSLFVKALIKRSGGNINESLSLFRQGYKQLNDNTNIYILKEIGKNFILLGKYKMAIEIYDSVLEKNSEDWDCLYHKGLCYFNLNMFNESLDCLNKANEINCTEDILITLGKLYINNNDIKNGIDKYENALDINPNNSDILTALGTLYTKQNDNERAFDYFEQAMEKNKKYSNSLLGLASIYQFQGKYEDAVIQYKISTITNPNSALVWNNLGLCFFAKNKFIAATTCLKKAIYLEPFEWMINFNLGLIYLGNLQYSSAFIYMNTAASLKNDYFLIYMYLGIILSYLDDIGNAIQYYDKALSLEEDYLVLYNYVVSLIKNEMLANAKEKLIKFEKIYSSKKGQYMEDNFIEEDLPKIKKILG